MGYEYSSPHGAYSAVLSEHYDNMNVTVKRLEPVEVLSQLVDMSTPQLMKSKRVTTVAASGVLCDSSLLSLEIIICLRLLTSTGAQMKTNMSLINQVAVGGQQNEAFGL